MLFKSDFEIATESYMPLLQHLLLYWRIKEVANDYVFGNTTAKDATAEVKKYAEAISDGTAAPNMTEKQRTKVRNWIRQERQVAEVNIHFYAPNVNTAVFEFESWFDAYEKQHFGL